MAGSPLRPFECLDITIACNPTGRDAGICTPDGGSHNLRTGQQVWQVTLNAPVVSGALSLPMSGLAAGDGLLVVPAGTKVTAYTLATNP